MARTADPHHSLGALVGPVDAETTAWYIQLQAEDGRGHSDRIDKRAMDALRTLNARRSRDIDEHCGARDQKKPNRTRSEQFRDPFG